MQTEAGLCVKQNEGSSVKIAAVEIFGLAKVMQTDARHPADVH